MERLQYFRLQKERSSVIRELLHDAEYKLLYVVFRSVGEVYCYTGVGVELFESMIAAESMGRFFTRNIKREFETTIVQPDVWESLRAWSEGRSRAAMAAEFRKNNEAWLKELRKNPLAIRF